MANMAAEFALLAGLCKYPEVYFEVAEFLGTDDFTQKAHQKFFIVLQRFFLDSDHKTDIIVTEADLMAKAAELNMNDFYSICDDGELIRACLQHSCDRSDVAICFRQVKKETVKATLKKESAAIIDYLKETPDDIDTIISHVEDKLIAANSRLQGATQNPVVHLASKAIEIVEDLANNPGELGVDIGLPTWQRGIGGIRNGAMTFIAAQTKAGKSQLAVRAAIEVARYGIPVLICDSELDETSQSVRMVGQAMESNYEVWETGAWKMDPDKLRAEGYDNTFIRECEVARKNFQNKEIREACKNLPIYYHSITGLSARDSIPFLRRWVMQHVGVDLESRAPRCLIVWDYIKLADINEVKTYGVGPHEILAADCGALHNFASRYNLPILAFGQTNRQLDTSLDCIAGAKKIAELSTSVSIYREKDENDLESDPHGSHMMRALVTRYGRGIKTYVNLEADLSIGKFTDLGVSQPRTVNEDDGDEETVQIREG